MAENSVEVRSAVYNTSGGIDCEINHPILGWVPFTASPDDVEQFGRDLFEQLQGNAAPAEEVE